MWRKALPQKLSYGLYLPQVEFKSKLILSQLGYVRGGT
jgi:hypothetical protein